MRIWLRMKVYGARNVCWVESKASAKFSNFLKPNQVPQSSSNVKEMKKRFRNLLKIRINYLRLIYSQLSPSLLSLQPNKRPRKSIRRKRKGLPWRYWRTCLGESACLAKLQTVQPRPSSRSLMKITVISRLEHLLANTVEKYIRVHAHSVVTSQSDTKAWVNHIPRRSMCGNSASTSGSLST